MAGTVTREGGCMCGKVRYRAEGEPVWVLHCHCESCRRSASAPMVTWVGYREEQFGLTGADPKSYASSQGVQRRFCGDCGSQLIFISERWPGEVHILAATLDDPASVTPTGHVYTVEKLPWLHLGDDLPRYEKTSNVPRE